MAGLSPKLPLVLDTTNGFALNTTYVDVVKQNFMGLILTLPGERIMDPDFGVGIRKYLFEIDDAGVRDEIRTKIIQQAAKYLPFVEVVEVTFSSQAQDISIDPNLLFVSITYIITPLEFVDKLDISIPNN